MWILKGTLLGTALFFVGTILYLLVMVYASAAKATGTTAIQGWTVQNPLYWIAFVVALAVGCVFVRFRKTAREN